MRRSHVLRTPPQGWASLAAFLLMLIVVGVAVSTTHPLELTGDQPWTLPMLMVTGGLVGFVLARSSVGLVRGHIIGSSVGAIILLFVVAAAVAGGESGSLFTWVLDPELLSSRMEALWEAVQTSIERTVSEEAPTDTQAAGMLILGAICWTTGQFGASSIYRFDRGVPAVASAGILLLLSVALRPTTGAEPLNVVLVLALFTTFAMLLLVRMQLNQQRTGWMRRHIADTGEVSRLFLRTGTLFVIFSVVGASTLTVATENTSFEGPWQNWDGQLPEIGDELEWLLRLIAVPTEPEVPTTFEGYQEISDRWEPGEGTAFVTGPDTDLRGNYWWGYAADSFDGQGWDFPDVRTDNVPAGDPVRAGRGDFDPDLRRSITVAIIAGDNGLSQGTLLAPAQAAELSRAAAIDTVDGGSVATVRYQSAVGLDDDPTVATVLALDYRPEDTALTESALRAAGTNYPEGFDRFLEIREGSIGQLTMTLADAIAREFNNPYDRARAVEQHLRGFNYNPTMIGRCDGYSSKTECLLGEEEGFCTFFSSTMAMALRHMGIPTRLVTGFLPGEQQPDGSYIVNNDALHAWTEVWFDGFGWVRFDPTPSRPYRQDWEPPPGDTPPLESPAAGSDDPLEPFPPEPSPDASPDAGFGPVDPKPPTDEGSGIPALLFVMLAVVTGFVLFAVIATVRLRRLPRPDAGLAFRGIAGLAARFGYGPHPSQTELEYAGTLSEVIPSVHDELFLVANAKVESSYAELKPVARDAGALRRAYARIRVALVRLSLRGKRPGG